MKNERSLPGDDVTIICSNPTHSGGQFKGQTPKVTENHLGRRGGHVSPSVTTLYGTEFQSNFTLQVSLV